MDLSPAARKVMEELRERRAGLLGRMDAGPGLRLTGPGHAWVLESRGLVVVCCPKCSTDVCIPKGQHEARAVCPVCGVWWTEETTVVPFVPRYG